MGAVMGSKNLKAIVVSGTGKVVPALDEEYKEVRKRVIDLCNESTFAQGIKEHGLGSGS